MTLPAIFNDPRAYAALVLLLAAVTWWQASVTYSRYTRIQRLKQRWFPLLNKFWSRFVHHKSNRSDAEFLFTTTQSREAVWTWLESQGGDPHIVSSVKHRRFQDADQYSDLHFVWQHDDQMQTEVFTFENDDGSHDVYAHVEPSVLVPRKHLNGKQTDGDARQVIGESVA